MNHEFSDADFTLEGQAFIDARLLDQLTSIQQLCASYAQKPSEANSKLLSDAANAHLQSVRIAFDHIEENTAHDLAVEEIYAYAKGLETQRVTFLNEFNDADDAQAYELADEDYDMAREHLLDEEERDDEDSPADHFLNIYSLSLNIDLNQFAANSISSYEQKPEVKRKEKLKKFGSHVLDVAKISAGVFIATTLANKFNKK